MTTVAEPSATAGRTARAEEAAGGSRPHRPRADAVRNRERIVAAARDAFVEYGPEAPLDEIARRAGIGNATLYRHFPDRHALAHAVLLSVVTRTADGAAAQAAVAAAGGDAYAALGRFAHAAVDERVGALCGLLVGRVDPRSPELTAQKARLEAALDELMARARSGGALRGRRDPYRPHGRPVPSHPPAARRRLPGRRRPPPPPALPGRPHEPAVSTLSYERNGAPGHRPNP